MKNTIQKYKQNLFRTLNSEKLSKEIEKLYETILSTWKRNNQIFNFIVFEALKNKI